MNKMNMSVTFLGTSSGGGPSESRNCSSLVCDMLADQSLWMVDCAEGTTRQFSLQPPYTKPHVRLSKVSKIFITHMHADHIMGIVPLLRNALFPPLPGNPPSKSSRHSPPRTIEIYGPYVVHELLTPEDSITPCDAPPASDKTPSPTMFTSESNVLHPSELVGLDIQASPDGFWRAITQGKGVMSPVIVDAGAILHRDPCIGYTFTEVNYPSRKLVILGDTYDPSPMIPLCINPSPSLLVHEATDSCISQHADPTGKLSRRPASEVHDKALGRGHSVPEMAGAFAKLIDARELVLNHIGGRFPAPRNPKDYDRHKIMQDIEHRASVAWGSGKRVTAAWDFLRVHIPYHLREDGASGSTFENAVHVSSHDDETGGPTHTRSESRPRDADRPDKRRAGQSGVPAPNDDKRRRR